LPLSLDAFHCQNKSPRIAAATLSRAATILDFFLMATLKGRKTMKSQSHGPRRWSLFAVLVAACMWSSAAHGVLVVHFDPNVTSTLFQDGGENAGGTIPVTQFGETVGWITDVASPTPGWDGVAIDGFAEIQQINPNDQPEHVYHPHGGILRFRGNQNLLGFDDNTGARMDGINGAFDSDVLQAVLVGRVQDSAASTGHFVDLRNAGTVGGFSVRYDYTSGQLQGVVNGEAVVGAPVNQGEFFVANFVWDGPNTTATLNVETLGGPVSVSGTPTTNTPIDHDRFRIGENANSADGIVGYLGDIYLYNDADDRTALVSQLAADYLFIPELVIDRATGNMSITVPSGVTPLTNIAGYSILSTAGALDPNQWQSIADFYDAGSPGPGQVDPDNNWTRLSGLDQRNDLSELEFEQSGGANNGADFLAGAATDLGDAWLQYYREDVEMLLVNDDGSTIPLYVRFTGNGGQPFDFGDLNFDGVIDADDFFDVFVPNYGIDTSTQLSGVERYQLGDLDESGAVTLEDFLLLNSAYLAANPGAASLSFAGIAVPEPSALLLLAMGAVAIVPATVRRRLMNVLAVVVVSVLAASGGVAQAAPGGVLDVDFEVYEPGSVFNDGSRIQDVSGNRYHGFWGGGAAANGTPIQLAFPNSTTVVNNEDNQGFIILRDDLPDGGTGSPNPWWGEGNTPTPYFTLDAGTSYTFEAVLNWNGDDQAIDGIMGQTGGTEWWIRENNGFLEYVFDDGPNRHLSTGTIDIGSQINNSDWHHLAITLARDSVDPTQVTLTSYLNYTEIFQEQVPVPLGAIGDGTADIRLGAYNTSATARFDGLMDHFRISDEVLAVDDFLPVPQPPDYVLEVNTATGRVRIINETGVDLTMDAYRLTSETGSLNPSAGVWTSLDAQEIGGAGAWTELGQTAFELSEGYFGGSSVFASPTTIDLGLVYADLGNEDASLMFEYHVPGEPGFRNMMIDFVDTVGGLLGDFNGDGIVDAADYTVWRDNLGAPDESSIGNNGDGAGGVDAGDYAVWRANFGNSAAALAGLDSATSVPEPHALAMVAVVLGLLALSRFGRRTWHFVPACAMLLSVLAAGAVASTADRFYAFGDPGTSDPMFGASVGDGNPMGFFFSGLTVTGDDVGPSGGFQDLQVNGATYASVSGRPGAAAGEFGASFNGAAQLFTESSLNAPSQFWDNTTFFPNGEFPLNYEGIFAHGIQFWARPDGTALGAGNRQDLVIDTVENGVYITADGNWGLQFDGGGDSGVSVDSTLDANGWAHVMQLGGYADLVNGRSAFQGALLVNGNVVAITSPSEAYDANSGLLSVGSNQAGDGNFYTGIIDNLELFLWGDNSEQLGADGQVGGTNGLGGLNADGQDWGSFSLLADNEFVAQQVSSLPGGVLQAGDVNLDGTVDGADITSLLGYWGQVNRVGNIVVGDWGTRQQGDLNFDGRTDIFDAILLRDSLNAGGANVSLADFFGPSAVPEPSSLALLAIAGLLAVTKVRQRSV
jgi:hypothetical protein